MKTEQQFSKKINFWRNLTSGSVNRQIFGAAVIVGLLTGLVKICSVGKELVVAWQFGTGDDLDAFLIALVVPFFIINVVAGSFKVALIPTYIRVREQQGSKAAQKLLSGSMFGALALLTVTATIVVSTAHWYLPLLASGFKPEKLDLTYQLIGQISPLVVLSGIVTLWGAVLNAGERFALAALSPVMTPVTTAILLVSFPDWGVFALTTGLIGGTLLEIVILGIGLSRQGIKLLPKWSGFDSNLLHVTRQYIPVTAGAFLMCSTNLVDQSMAAMLSSGSVAALGYANRVIALPLSLTTLALGTAVIPYFSKTIAQQDWGNVRRIFQHYLKWIFIVTIPLTFLFIFGSESIIRLLLERGSFTAEDTYIISQIQINYALQIPFYISSILVVRLINSLGINYILALGSTINLIANVAANYVLMQWIGVRGIALSTSCVYLISFVFLYVLTNKHLQKYSEKNSIDRGQRE